MQCFAWKNGFELLSSGPACLIQGPCVPSLQHKFSYHHKGNKLNSEKTSGWADSIVPSLAPAGRKGQPAPSLGFTRETWRDFLSQSVARSANKEPTASSSRFRHCPSPASHPPGVTSPLPPTAVLFLGMLQHGAVRGSWGTLGIPEHTLPL